MSKLFKSIKLQLIRIKRKNRLFGKSFDKSFWKNFNWRKLLVPGLILLGLLLSVLIIILIKKLPPRAPSFKKSSNAIYSYEAKNRIFQSNLGIKNNAPVISFNANKNESVTFLYQDHTNDNPNIKVSGKELIFEGVENNIDLRYQTLPTGIKEEIILHQARQKEKDPNVFIFAANLQGAYLKESLKGIASPIFYDQNDQYLFHFEKPFAIDANGNRTDNVSLQIEDKVNSKLAEVKNNFSDETPYLVRLTVDENWLNDPNRKYPITIDPSIVIAQDTSEEFAPGQLNRVKDTGSGSSPSLETYYQELMNDEYTVGLWHLNETGGTTAFDTSSNNNDGTITGTTIVDGILDKAKGFTYTNTEYVSIPDSSSLDLTTAYTLEAWIYPEYSNNWRAIINKGVFSSSYAMMMDATGTLRCYTNNTNNLDSTFLIPNGQWTHVACVWDGNNKYLYINGELNNTGSWSGTLTNNADALTIGRDVVNNAYTFSGSIDEARVSSIARSAEEIKASASRRSYSTYTSDVIDLTKVNFFNSLTWSEFGVATGDGETAKDSTGLLAQWNFNETSGTTLNNNAGSCGAGCNGTLTNFADTSARDVAINSGWTSNNQRWGAGALMFDGSNDYVNVGDIASVDALTAFSVCAWVNHGALSADAHIISKTNSSDGWSGFMFLRDDVGQVSGRTDTYKLHVNQSISTTAASIEGATDSSKQGVWNYVCGTFTANSATGLRLYVNGVEDPFSPVSTEGITSIDSGTTNMVIGRYDPTGANYFLGNMDSLQLYSRVLTPAEILSNYNVGQVELQTRIGSTADANDASWEAWKPITGDAQIKSFDLFSLNLTSNLISYWPMDESAGNTVFDHQSTNNGTATNISSQTSLFGKAKSFSGSSYITVPDSSSLDITGNFTISAWVNKQATGNRTILSKTGTSGSGGFGILVGNSGEVYCRTDNGTTYADSYTNYTGNYVSTTSGWTHVTAVLNGTSCKIYINGVDRTNTDNTHASPAGNSLPLIIGARGDLGTEYWSGYIDEVRIYNKALSATEVLLDYSYRSSKPDSLVDDLIKFEGTGSLKINNGTAKLDASTIGLWHLDETNGTGSFLKDSSANLNHGSFNDSTTIDGIANKARSFTSSQYITVPHASNLIPSTGKITMEAWFKTTQSTVNVYDSTLITKLDGSPYPGYRLAAGAGKISCWIGAGAYVTSGSTINDGKWHHAACTNDGKITTVYVDGRKETISAQVPSLSSTADLLLAYGFEGSIDEIKISNTNKSDEEIAESYRIGKNHYLNTTLDVSDLVGKKFLPFYIAADKPGTYLNFTIGESNYVNNQADSNTVGLWHLDEQNVAINQPPTPQVFSYTSGAQSYVVPAGVTAVTVKSWGAGGAGGGAGGAGGGGAYSYSVLPVTPGETLTIYVGGGGSPGLTVKTNAGGGAGGGGAYGLGGRGGNAGATGTSAGGGGGGAGSFVARSSTILVAAGGGGGGGGAESGGGAGAGGGGGANGANGACSSIGGTAGASSTANGLAGGDKGSADGSGGGGAGGGYLGGSGGTAPTCDSQGGAGGAGGTSLGDTINNGSGTTAGNASDIDRGVNGNGGGANGAGTNGRIVINPVWPTSNLVKDESNNGNHAYLALGTAGFITTPTTFSYTGGAQSYVVPAGVTAVTVKSWGGGGGGGGSPGAAGGGGAYSYSVLPVTPGETLTVHVGGGGGAGLSVKTGTGGGAGGGGAYGLGGRGGNAGGTGTSAGGGGGGAGSFVTRGSTVLLAAGGGGGGAGAESSGAGAGGGGGANGANGSCSSIGGSPNYSESANGNAGGDKSGDGSGGGGAGGGYLGGSGGGAPSCDSTGGAGGGGGRNLGVITANGSGTTAGNASDADRGTAGNGGAVAGAGVAGKIIISVANVAPPTGKYGLTRYFNGSSDAIVIAENDTLDPSEITLEAWIKPTTLSGEGNFINKGDNLGYRFRALSDGSLRFYDRGATNYITTPANVIRVGTWHHVVAVGSSAGLKIYVNGQLLASNTVAYGSPNTSADLILGKLSTDAEYFNGLIDEVRISNVVRSAEEIRQTYELESRTHLVTIDFSAQLAYTNLISDNTDKSFDIDATVYGSSSKGASLYTGDKIIIRENYNGTEYVAQGIVNTVNASTGAVTVASWDSGSTFPAIGFTTQATVFKWQKEYWPISKPLASQLDSITNLTISLTSGNEGQNIWIDDLNSSGGYLSDPSGSTITSSTGSRYFQYRAILSSHDEAVTSTLSSATLDYMANDTPATPSLDSPANGAINQSLTPALLTKTTDLDSDYLRYKIQLCTNADMTANCQTFDQTSSQVGWSGQNAQTNTAYTSGTQATYTIQTGLSADTTYYWRSYAIDPGGSNTWSATQSTPYSFVVSANPTMPTLPRAENLTNPSAIVDLTPEFTAVHNDPNGDSAIHYEVEVNTANDFSGTVMWDSGQHSMTSTANGARSPNISYAGTPLTFQGATYYWRIRFWDTFGLVSAWSETQNFSMNNIPYEPTLDLPVTGSGDMEFLPALKTTGSDQDSDYLFYKIQLCTNSAMTANCQTFDQTSSQVGWSGQNAQTNTAYTSGTQATYTIQTGLSADTTYYWRSYAIDPGGSNTWSATQSTPYSFTTLATPVPASACYIQESINKDQLLFVWTDNAINEDFYEVQRSVDGGAWTALQTGLAPDTTSLLDTSITSGHTYQYRVAPYFVGPYYASWCLANTLNIGVGLFNLEGINASGLHFN